MSNRRIGRLLEAVMAWANAGYGAPARPHDGAHCEAPMRALSFAELLAASVHLDFTSTPGEFLHTLEARCSTDGADRREGAR